MNPLSANDIANVINPEIKIFSVPILSERIPIGSANIECVRL
jgi:hypothetical protein